MRKFSQKTAWGSEVPQVNPTERPVIKVDSSMIKNVKDMEGKTAVGLSKIVAKMLE